MLPRPALVVTSLAFLFLSSCYTNTPQLWESSDEQFTYVSTPSRPVTITLVDTRDQSEFFRIDIPVGKQLSFRFHEGDGDDPVNRPAKMEWAVFDEPSWTGSLSNSLSVPPMHARRIDYTLRPNGELAPPKPEAPMRVEPTPKPQWETTAGGSSGSSNSKKLYD
ncbi:MAG: hypothetical protein U0572_02275 [Phycisphaerales bacterium]